MRTSNVPTVVICGLVLGTISPAIWYFAPSCAAQELKPTLIIGDEQKAWRNTSARFSPDGRFVITGGSEVRIWDVATGLVDATLDEGLSALSEDCKVVATVQSKIAKAEVVDATITAWDIATRKALFTAKGRSATLTPDGTLLAVARNEEIELFSVPDGKPMGTFKRKKGGYGLPRISPDGKLLCTADDSLWNIETGDLRTTFQGQLIAFTPDGKTLLTADEKGLKTIVLESGKEGPTFSCTPTTALSAFGMQPWVVAVSPDGKLLATVESPPRDYPDQPGLDDAVNLWDLATGKKIATLKGQKNYVTSLAFSPDGACLAMGTGQYRNRVSSGGGDIALWDVRRKTIYEEVSPGQFVRRESHASYADTLIGHTAPVISLAFSRDGSSIVSVDQNSAVRLWNLAFAKDKGDFLAHPKALVTSLVYSCNGKRFATGSTDSTIAVWDAATKKLIVSFKSPTGPLASFPFGSLQTLAFSPDDRVVASAGDETIWLWDCETGKLVSELKGHKGNSTSVAFSQDGKTVASGGTDRSVRLWDVSTGKNIITWDEHSRAVQTVAISPDGKAVASGGVDGTVRIWKVGNDQSLVTLRGHKSPVQTIAFSPDGRLLASGTRKDVILWDVSKQRSLLALHDLPGAGNLAFGQSGKALAVANSSGLVSFHAVPTGELLFKTGTSTANQKPLVRQPPLLAISPDGQTLAVTTTAGAIQFWTVPSDHRETILSERRFIHCLAFSPDGKKLVAGMGDKTVTVWDATKGRNLFTLKGHKGQITSVAYSSDGKIIASGSEDGTVILWDAIKGLFLARLDDHTGSVRAVAFGRSGKRLVSGSDDGTMILWDVESGRSLHVLRGSGGGASTVGLSPDEKSIATYFVDVRVDFSSNPLERTVVHTVEVWESDTGKLKQREVYKGNGLCVQSPDGEAVFRTVEPDQGKANTFNRIMGGALTMDGKMLLIACEATNASPSISWKTKEGHHVVSLPLFVPSSGRGLPNIRAVAFSPDRTKLAAAWVDGRISVHDIEQVKK